MGLVKHLAIKTILNILTRTKYLEKTLKNWDKSKDSLIINFLISKAAKKHNITPDKIKEELKKKQYQQFILNIADSYAKGFFPPRFLSPVLVVWNFTNLCNLKCRHCYQTAGMKCDLSEELSLQEKLNLVEHLIKNRVSYLAFSGGEPLVHKDFWKIAEKASDKMHISIATNGTLLEENIEKLKKIKGLFIQVSLDSLNPEKHDSFRGQKGAWEKTVRGIKAAVKAGLSIGLAPTITKQNFHEVEDMIKWAEDMGMGSFIVYNYVPVGRGKEIQKFDLTPEQREELLNTLYKHMYKSRLSIVSTAPQLGRICAVPDKRGLFDFKIDKDRAGKIRKLVELIGGCGSGKNYCCIEPNGDVTPCVFIPEIILGNIRERGFIDIWRNSEILDNIANRKTACRDCDYANVCGGCRARAYHLTGTVLGADTGCLQYLKRKSQRLLTKTNNKTAETTATIEA